MTCKSYPVCDPIKETKVIRTTEIVYLGDIFNHKGNNDALIKDRVARGVKAGISITSILIESDLGKYHINLCNTSLFSSILEKNSASLKCFWTHFLKHTLSKRVQPRRMCVASLLYIIDYC